MKTLFRKITYLTTAFALFYTIANAQDGKTIFSQKCAACHTVGGGRLVGPDLESLNYRYEDDWIIKFVQSSQALIKSGDADAIKIYESYNKMMMPDQALSDAEVKSIITYIESVSPEPKTDSEEVEEEEIVVEEPTITEEDIASGKQLFLGHKRFENSGVTCVSCHNVASKGMIPGGKLAVDLTGAYSRLGGMNGLKAILNTPPFPAMKASYANNPLTEEEVFQLQAFLKDADANRIYHIKSEYNSFFMFAGFFALITILTIIATVWSNKKKGHVKEDIYNRQVNTK